LVQASAALTQEEHSDVRLGQGQHPTGLHDTSSGNWSDLTALGELQY
jgi:hypothetical protein